MSNFFAALLMLLSSLFSDFDSGSTQDPNNDNAIEEQEEVEVPDSSNEYDNISDEETVVENQLPVSGYTELVFSDEFDGPELNRNIWCTRYIYGGGSELQVPDDSCQPIPGSGTLDFLNDERQRYVDFNRSGETMHAINDGVLHLRATATRTDDEYAGYESAMIRSKELFKPSTTISYYMVARVMLPNVVGTWPAFWLNSDFDENGNSTWPPEIDIFEGALNGVEDTAFMLHQATIIKGKQTESGESELSFTSDEFDLRWKNYHSNDGSLRNRWLKVGLEWTVNGVCFYIDGYKTACENYSWVTNYGDPAANAHILLNLAIGGSWAGRYGIGEEFLEHFTAEDVEAKGLSTRFPTHLAIDYVRVYKK